MNIKASEILNLYQKENLLTELIGDDYEINNMCALENASRGDLCFTLSKDIIKDLRDKKDICVIVEEKNIIKDDPELLKIIKENNLTLLTSSNTKLVQAKIKLKYFDREWVGDWERIHESSIIHKTTIIPESVHIGPNVVIGSNVKLGERVVVLAGTVIERGVEIGDDSIIHSNVFIGFNTIIGKKVLIFSNTVIASEGFGFAQDSKFNHTRIPQTGRVRLGNNIRIGALCAIDRPAFGETILEDGVIFDNLVHIAHGVVVGENSIITAACVIAGSTKIGKRVVMSGQTGVLDHLEIADDVYLLHKAGVAKNIEKSGAYAGIPSQPLNEYMRNNILIGQIADLKKRIAALEKK